MIQTWSKKWTNFLWSILLFGSISVAQSPIKITLDPLQWNGENTRLYNPFQLQQIIQTVPGYLFCSSSSRGPFFITISKGGQPNFDRNLALGSLAGKEIDTLQNSSVGYDRKAWHDQSYIRYQFFNSAQCLSPIKALPEAQTGQDVIPIFLSDTASTPIGFNVYWIVPPGQVVPPGVYTDVVTLTAYEGTIEGSYPVQVLDSLQVKLSITVTETLSYRIQIEGLQNDSDKIEFGRLKEGKQKHALIVVYTNVPYRLTLSSQYKGRLKYRAPDVLSFLPYTIDLAAQRLTWLTPATASLSKPAASSSSGDRYPLTCTIGKTTSFFSGLYLDKLSIDLQSL